MSIVFNPDALDAWGRFSGDVNPIHFDSQVAQDLLGLDGPVVHGMLAMLELKSAFSKSLQDNHDPAALHWTAMLRRPIPARARYRIDTTASGSPRIRTNLVCANAGTKFITSTSAPAQLAQTAHQSEVPAERFLVQPAVLAAQLSQFRDLYPDLRHGWIFLDALLFSQFVRVHCRESLASAGISDSSFAADAGGVALLMQGSHSVTASPDVFKHGMDLVQETLEYEVSIVSASQSTDARYVIVQLPCFIGGRLIFVQEMVLLYKARPGKAAH